MVASGSKVNLKNITNYYYSIITFPFFTYVATVAPAVTFVTMFG